MSALPHTEPYGNLRVSVTVCAPRAVQFSSRFSDAQGCSANFAARFSVNCTKSNLIWPPIHRFGSVNSGSNGRHRPSSARQPACAAGDREIAGQAAANRDRISLGRLPQRFKLAAAIFFMKSHTFLKKSYIFLSVIHTNKTKPLFTNFVPIFDSKVT